MILDWVTLGQHISEWQMIQRILVALAIGAIIGIDRQIKNRPAGMRTHVLVCLGATLISMVQQAMVADVVNLGAVHVNVSLGRLTGAIVSGVGFLGAGTIIVSDRKIMGLTTAASLWCTACLGLAVGAGYTTMALFACLIVMAVLKLMQRVVHVHTLKRLEVQFIHRTDTLTFIKEQMDQLHVKILDQDFHAETMPDGTNLYTNVYTLAMPGDTSYQQVIGRLSQHPNVRAARTRSV